MRKFWIKAVENAMHGSVDNKSEHSKPLKLLDKKSTNKENKRGNKRRLKQTHPMLACHSNEELKL